VDSILTCLDAAPTRITSESGIDTACWSEQHLKHMQGRGKDSVEKEQHEVFSGY
jgi:hypothetical protein